MGKSENAGNREEEYSLRRAATGRKPLEWKKKIYYSNELLNFQTEGSTVVFKYCSVFAGF